MLRSAGKKRGLGSGLFCWRVATAGVLLLAGNAARAGVEPHWPGVVSVAVNDDATALFVNPAAIDRSVPWGFVLSTDQSEDAPVVPDVWSYGLTLGALGLGYQQTRPAGEGTVQQYIVALGGATERVVSIGLRGVYQRQTRPAGPGPFFGGTVSSKTWRWDAGLLCRPAPFLSAGATVEDFTQSSFFQEPIPRAYRLGLALRPLSANARTRLTLFGDVRGEERQTWSRQAELETGLTVEPVPGLEVFASLDGSLGDFSGSRRLRAGLSLHLLGSTSVFGLFFDPDDRHSGTGYGIHHSSAREPALVERPECARLRLSGRYGDESEQGLPLPFLGSPTQRSARPVLTQLHRAETDPAIKGVLLEIEPLTAGALTEEIRDAIHRVRDQGKPVVAHLEYGYGWSQYYIAAACDRIVLDPVSAIGRLGYRAELSYYGEFLDTLGVEFEKVAAGKYKTAYETLVLSGPSEGMTESLDSVIDDLHRRRLDEVAADRGIDRDHLAELADGRILESPLALKEGLVDTLGDRRDARKLLADLAGTHGRDPISVAGWTYRQDAWSRGPAVAVLWLDGTIETGPSRRGLATGNTLGSETVVEQLRSLRGRRDVRAVVVRIDSPGGNGLASDQIWRAIEELRKSGKVVVASMSRIAASGGYYIASAAGEIFADPGTITGSIGVVLIKPNLAGFHDRHGIHVGVFERGRMMGLYSTNFPWTEEERRHLTEKTDLFYGHFLDRVAAGRPLDRNEVDAVGQGRIWTGRQALERKLIDRLGGLSEAVARAKELAGLDPEAPVVDVYRPGWSFLERLVFQSRVGLQGLGSTLGLSRGISSDPERNDASTSPAAGEDIGAVPEIDLDAGEAWPGKGYPGEAISAGFDPSRSPLDQWLYRKAVREAEHPGSLGSWRAECALAEMLAAIL